MRNYLNTNDVYPILDLIRREIRRNNFNRDREPVGKTYVDLDDDDAVASVEIIRGGSTYDPDMINSVVVSFASGSVEVVEIIRGVVPPLPSTEKDYEFFNNVLISGLRITTTTADGATSTVNVTLTRRGGTGAVEKVDISYN